MGDLVGHWLNPTHTSISGSSLALHWPVARNMFVVGPSLLNAYCMLAMMSGCGPTCLRCPGHLVLQKRSVSCA